MLCRHKATNKCHLAKGRGQEKTFPGITTQGWALLLLHQGKAAVQDNNLGIWALFPGEKEAEHD